MNEKEIKTDRALTVGELKRALERLPDDMSVIMFNHGDYNVMNVSTEVGFIDNTRGVAKVKFIPEDAADEYIDDYLSRGFQPVFIVYEK